MLPPLRCAEITHRNESQLRFRFFCLTSCHCPTTRSLFLLPAYRPLILKVDLHFLHVKINWDVSKVLPQTTQFLVRQIGSSITSGFLTYFTRPLILPPPFSFARPPQKCGYNKTNRASSPQKTDPKSCPVSGLHYRRAFQFRVQLFLFC